MMMRDSEWKKFIREMGVTTLVCKSLISGFPPGPPRLSPESPFGPPSAFHNNVDLGWASEPAVGIRRHGCSH